MASLHKKSLRVSYEQSIVVLLLPKRITVLAIKSCLHWLENPRCSFIPHRPGGIARKPLKTNAWFRLQLRYNVRPRSSRHEVLGNNFT